MKKKATVRIGAATIYVSKQDKTKRNCFERLFAFCDKWLPKCGCDIVVLPEPYEFLEEDIQPLDGVNAQRFIAYAKKYKLFLIAPLAEKVGKRFHLAQVVISPKGKIIHNYRKVHGLSHDSETNTYLRGKEFKTFELPWFRAGIMVCFDNQFPESSRSLAIQGAKVVFFPSFGDLYKPHRDAARCLDNHIYLIGASHIDRAIGLPASKFEQGMIMNPKGKIITSTKSKEGLAIGELPLVKGKLAEPELSGDTLSTPVNYLKWRRPMAYINE